MADLKYNVIISTDSAIKSLEGFKKVIEGFTKEIKLNFDTQAIKSVSNTLQQIQKDVTALNKIKINFDVSKLTIPKFEIPKLDTATLTRQLNLIGTNSRTIQFDAKLTNFNLPNLKAIEIPVAPKFNGLSDFGNGLVNTFANIPNRIGNIFSNFKLPSFNISGIFEGLQSLTNNVASSSGKSFGNVFAGAIGNIIQITIGNLLANAISTATSYIASQTKDFLGQSVTIEQSNQELKRLLGTQEKANKLIKDTQILARTTPYAFPELIDSTKQLLAFGVPAERVLDITSRLGDIAGGSKTKLANLTALYGKIASQDFVSAGNINSATKFGITISDIATELGITSKELTKFKSTGKLSREQIVSYEEFDAVIKELTSDQGRFKDASINSAKTLGGLFSNIPDIFGNITDDLLGVSQGVVKTGGAFSILKQIILDFNNAFLGTDFTAYTLGFGKVFQTIVDLAKQAILGISKVFAELTKGITFDSVSSNLKSFGEFIANVFNSIDFVGITKNIAGLFSGLNFVDLGNSIVEIIKAIGDLGSAIEKTPEFKQLEGLAKEAISKIPDVIKAISSGIKELSKDEKGISNLIKVVEQTSLFAVALTAIGLAIVVITNPIVQFFVLLTGVTAIFNSIIEAGDKLVKWFADSTWLQNAQKGWSDFWTGLGAKARKEFDKIIDYFNGKNPFIIKAQAETEIKKPDGSVDYTNNLQNDTTAPNQGSTGGNNLIDSITNTYNVITTYISTKLLEIQGFWNGLNIYIQVQTELVKQWFIAKYNEIGAYLQTKFVEFQAFYDSLPARAEIALEQVKQWFLIKFEEAKAFVQIKIDEIGSFFNNLPQKASNAVDTITQYFVTGASKWVNSITNKFEGIGSTIISYFNNIKLPTLTLPPINLPALPNLGALLGAKSNYTGNTNFAGGITEIAERGRELVKLPNGILSIFNDRQYTALPKGTVIYNNQDTERLLNEGYLKGSNVLGGNNSNISSSSVQNTVINRPTNIYSTNYNGYQTSSYLNPLSS